MAKSLTLAELEKDRKLKKEKKELIDLYVSYFDKMFPKAPIGQGKFIIEDALKNGKVIYASDLSIHDKIFYTTLAFLRHQFYFKLHYGYKDKRLESNQTALRIMHEEWGYTKRNLIYMLFPEPRKMVTCPSCLGNGCSLCLKGFVLHWVAQNYRSRLWFQQYE